MEIMYNDIKVWGFKYTELDLYPIQERSQFVLLLHAFIRSSDKHQLSQGNLLLEIYTEIVKCWFSFFH